MPLFQGWWLVRIGFSRVQEGYKSLRELWQSDLQGSLVRFSRSATSDSNLARVRVMLRCFAPARAAHQTHLRFTGPNTCQLCGIGCRASATLPKACKTHHYKRLSLIELDTLLILKRHPWTLPHWARGTSVGGVCMQHLRWS